jgi:hypothetical protein
MDACSSQQVGYIAFDSQGSLALLPRLRAWSIVLDVGHIFRFFLARISLVLSGDRSCFNERKPISPNEMMRGMITCAAQASGLSRLGVHNIIDEE